MKTRESLSYSIMQFWCQSIVGGPYLSTKLAPYLLNFQTLSARLLTPPSIQAGSGARYEARVIAKTPEQRARIERAMQRSFMFRALDEAQLDRVILAMEEKAIPAHTDVITQGAEVADEDDGLYMLEAGRMNV